MTEPQTLLDELTERAAAAWWDACDDTGKRIANRGWDEIPEEWKADYRRRARAVVVAIGVWP